LKPVDAGGGECRLFDFGGPFVNHPVLLHIVWVQAQTNLYVDGQSRIAALKQKVLRDDVYL
jgi:hypothetical protein